MCHHINTVVRSCFFHLRRLKSVRRILGAEVTSGLVSAFVTTRLDYLLQLSPRRPSTIDDWSTSTCLECGGQTCCRNKNSGPHHSSPPEPTLASDQVPQYLQALRVHAPGASWSQPLRACRTWWHPTLTCLVVRDWDPPAASDMNFHGWN